MGLIKVKLLIQEAQVWVAAVVTVVQVRIQVHLAVVVEMAMLRISE